MTLYLKYRPQRLGELDLEGVRESLTKIFKSRNIPHAFLFAGPKGTGKTSAARIVAKILNCEKNIKVYREPCNKCTQCLTISKGSNIDVIELDAASHRGIDDIRVLRDAVKLSPAKAKKKVYIIDEAHMLTTEAFNALLKTLEEPPEHAVFILATTNLEKIIDTIKSRTTVILFNRATQKELVSSLKKKVRSEKIKFNEDALASIAKNADGSFRDATKILEQLIAENIPLLSNEVDKYYQDKLTINLDEFISDLNSKNEEKLLEVIEKVAQKGVSFTSFIGQLLGKLHTELLVDAGIGHDKIIFSNRQERILLIQLLMDAYLEARSSFIEQLPLELAVIKWCNTDKVEDNNELGKSVSIKQEGLVNGNKELKESEESVKKDEPLPEILEEAGSFSEEVWKKILGETGLINASVEALLRAARPLSFDGNTLKLGVYYKFHKERLEEEKQKRILEEVAGKILNCQLRINCILTEPPKKEIKPLKDETILIEPDLTLTESNGSEKNPDSLLTEEVEEDIIKVAKKIFS